MPPRPASCSSTGCTRPRTSTWRTTTSIAGRWRSEHKWARVLHARRNAVPATSRRCYRRIATTARSRPATSPSASARRARGGTGTTPRSRSSTCSGTGRVTVTRAPGDFARIYDLTERVIPPRCSLALRSPEHEARKQLLELAARHHGIGTFADLTDYHRQKQRAVQAAGRRARRGGRAACRSQVEGWTKPAYLHHDARVPRRITACALPQPVRSRGLEPRPGEPTVRLPLPDRDLHAAAEADLRLLRAAVPAGRQRRRPARPEGRPTARRAAGAGRRSPSRVCPPGRWPRISLPSCMQWPGGWASVRSRLCSEATWPPPFAMRSVTTLGVDVRTPVVVAARAPAAVGVESGRHLLARLHPRDRHAVGVVQSLGAVHPAAGVAVPVAGDRAGRQPAGRARVAPRHGDCRDPGRCLRRLPRLHRRDRHAGRSADRRPARRLREVRQPHGQLPQRQLRHAHQRHPGDHLDQRS